MQSRQISWYFATGVSIVFLGLVGCSITQPAIAQSTNALVISKDVKTNTVSKFLAVFVAVNDSSGTRDMESLYVLSDSQTLLWHIDTDHMERFDLNGSHWVGSSKLEPPFGEAMPSGRMRVLLYDRAGHETDGIISVSAEPANLAARIPSVHVEGDVLSVNPPLDAATGVRELITKDWSGAELGRVVMKDEKIPLSQVLHDHKPADVAFYVQDSSDGGGIVLSSGPWQ